MKAVFYYLLPILFCSFTACKTSSFTQTEFLEGTWKVENKEQYEVWEKAKKKQLTGYSYRIKEEKKVISETLSIKKSGKEIVYEATVPSQNQGQTIPFTLNSTDKEYVSFENKEHDFPQKIQYLKIGEDEVLVRVLGKDDKGFSYKMLRQ